MKNGIKVDIGLTERLRHNIELLIARCEKLSADNAELSATLEARDNTIANDKIQIAQLKERLDKLQLTSAISASSPDRAEAKRKISHLISEIDRCIALLGE